ncbi:tetratricopeptide repeat protein [Fulvimarina sp. 2208YS6-2-32]|uniref:Tetratricopeptide repeat protein n=2 Tax=Fulvimarina uroteuthidis TaxID=3098149 RepID=A0ABU5I3W7_9HYPH|nr:tetratricopeptide repeat protein [Fulvimarina sp. 2208YS6-2-32]
MTVLVVSGCANKVSHETTGSIARPAGLEAQPAPARAPASTVAQMSSGELRTAVDAYGQRYETDPKNKQIGLGYSAALQMAGRNEQSLAVMQQVAISHPKDRDVLSAYGKALAAAGDLPKALETIRRAQTPDYPDWRLYSAEGAILDQLGRPDEARALFQKALVLKPNEATVLSNLGLSYLLADDLPQAEHYLTAALRQPDGDARIRQNLALAIGLQGRFEEAEKVAAGTLSPDEAKANVAFLREMLSQTNTWSKLKQEGQEG